jgi:hypothetical protein
MVIIYLTRSPRVVQLRHVRVSCMSSLASFKLKTQDLRIYPARVGDAEVCVNG